MQVELFDSRQEIELCFVVRIADAVAMSLGQGKEGTLIM
jgi:hypothetical protein